jgi:hypothetical protein
MSLLPSSSSAAVLRQQRTTGNYDRRKIGKTSVLSTFLLALIFLFFIYNYNYHPTRRGDGRPFSLFIASNTDGSSIPTTTIAGNDDDDTSNNDPTTAAAAAVSPAASSATTATAEARAQRMKMYKDRYKYTPPVPYIQHTEREELCGTYPNFDTYFNMPTLGPRNDPQRSANDEDKTIYDLFFKHDEQDLAAEIGSVVEMGAFNGIQESNSRFFETCLGWNTLLVEGNPLLWEKVLENRPHAHKFSFAPSCSEQEEMANKTVPFDKYPMTNAGVNQGNVTTAYTFKKWYVDVPCGSMTKVLLDVFPNGHVTFFSLDVEGAEPLVVGNIDFDKVFIEIMMIESRNNFCQDDSCESKRQFRKIMLDAGYVLFRPVVEKSDLFLHPLSDHLETIRKKTGMKGITKDEF